MAKMSGKKLCTPAILGSWSIVNFVQQRRFPEEQVNTFTSALVRACSEMGLTVKNRTPPIVYANPAGNITQFMREAWVKAGNFAKAQPQIIVCIVPAVEATLYAEIKVRTLCELYDCLLTWSENYEHRTWLCKPMPGFHEVEQSQGYWSVLCKCLFEAQREAGRCERVLATKLH